MNFKQGGINPYKSKPRTHKKKFSAEEDAKLEELYNKYGFQWTKISENFEGRNPRQCRDRWNHYLSPTIDNSNWSKEEDDKLMELYAKFGNHWSLISKNFEKRTCVSVRNRCCKLAKNNLITPNFFIEPIYPKAHPPLQSMNNGRNNFNMNNVLPPSYSVSQVNYISHPCPMPCSYASNNFNSNNCTKNAQPNDFMHLDPFLDINLDGDDILNSSLDHHISSQRRSQEKTHQISLPVQKKKQKKAKSSSKASLNITSSNESLCLNEVPVEPIIKVKPPPSNISSASSKIKLPPCTSLPFMDVSTDLNLL